VLVALALLAALTGCSPGSLRVSKAQQVFEEKLAESPDYAAYGFSILTDTTSPFARGLIVESIGSDHYPTALQAVHALGDEPPEEARTALVETFSGKSGALKLQSAVALARLGDADAIAWLREQIREGGAQLTPSVVKVLAEEGDHELLLPALEPYLSSDEPSIRDEGYVMLGEVGQPWATELLLEGLEKEHGEGRIQAIVSLGQTGSEAAAKAIEPFVNTQGLVFASLEALGDLRATGAATNLGAMATHDEALVRVYAGVALWKIGDEEGALAVLEPLAGDEDATVRTNLAEQLEDVEADAATALLIALGRDGDKNVRAAAVRSLIGRTSPEASAFLREAIVDEQYEVATLALNGLARIGGPEDIAGLASLLDSGNPYVALSAAHAILAIEGRGAGTG
jgi:HEAT repeat protein